MKITRQTYNDIIEHARKAAPIEACGYLAEQDGIVVKHIVLTNTDNSPEHFSLDPKEQFAAVKKMRAEKMKLKAVCHSHPASPARPSAEDIRLAFDPEISYVIVSLEQNSPDVKSFRIKNSKVEAEDIEIIECHARENGHPDFLKKMDSRFRGNDNAIFYEIPSSLLNEIDELEKNIVLYRKGILDAAKFKAFRVPFGIYEQRKSDTYMVRIRCTGGAVTPGQLKAVAMLGKPIHLTTRQELQIHGVTLESIPEILRKLLKSGLSTRGGGGNTVRNITASSDSGIAGDEAFDVMPYVSGVTSMLICEPDSWTLPRKYKIAFSNSETDSAHAVFNDLGFIAVKKDGIPGFKVYAAGGMGARPQAGQVLHEFIEADYCHAVAKAVKKVFHAHGNRKNRHTARLRFLWNKIGREKFIELYADEFKKLKEDRIKIIPFEKNVQKPALTAEPAGSEEFNLFKKRYITPQRQIGLYSILVPVWLGDMECSKALLLAEALIPFGADTLRCTLEQNFSIRNIPEEFLGNIFNIIKTITGLSLSPKILGTAVACTGSATCKLGICLSQEALKAIRRKLSVSGINLDEISDLKINLSGCPNTCGAHMASDLGFYGKVSRNKEHIYPAYMVVAGAKTGSENPSLAVQIGEVSAYKLPDFAERFLKIWVSKKNLFQDFGAYLEKEGKNDISGLLQGLSGVPDFTEDKNYYYDHGSSEIFSLAGKGKGECSAGLFDLIEADFEIMKKLKNGDLSEESLYKLLLVSSRVLLITRGIEAHTDAEVFDQFKNAFISKGLISDKYIPVLENLKTKALNKEEVLALAADVEALYARMDDSLKLPEDTVQPAAEKKLTKDLRGVACPMNFVKTKIELSKIQKGMKLEVLLDDGPPIQNVPRSVEEEGHKIIEQTKTGDYWAVLIEKG